MAFAASVLLLFLSFSSLLGDNVFRINNINDLINFSNSVNNKTTYEGTTVLLDSDIVFTDELSQKFESIGKILQFTS